MTLFVSDMDGTLLDDRSRVSATSAALLREAVARGALFTVATARTHATAVPLLRDIPLRLPVIVMAGAAMYDTATGRFSNVSAFAGHDLARLFDIYRRHNVNPLIYRLKDNILHVYHRGALSPAETTFINQRLDTVKRFHLNDNDCESADGDTLILYSMDNYERLTALHRDLDRSGLCRAFLSRDLFDNALGELEVYALTTSKAAAIARLAAMTGATRTVVYGDNLNDIDMMRKADVAIAVDNALPEVKAVATRVIGPNTDDSVAKSIKTMI